MFDENVSPETTTIGPGVRAIHRVLDGDPAFERAVTFAAANPPAAVAHRRYLDEDTNRVFPGDADADSRERRGSTGVDRDGAGSETIGTSQGISPAAPTRSSSVRQR